MTTGRQSFSSINNMKHKKLHFVISLFAPPSGLEPETP